MKPGWNNLVDAIWRQPIATMDRSAMSLSRWFDSPLGRAVLEQQWTLIDSIVTECRPEILLLATPCGQGLILPESSTPSMWVQICPGRRNLKFALKDGATPVLADLDALPMHDNSVDLVLLHHSVEFSENPHQVLREATRVLAPGGNLVIVGFNPWSLFGARRLASRMGSASAPWAHHALSASRLIDWMHLMSCEPVGVARGFYGVPTQYRRGFKRLAPVDRYLSDRGAPGGAFFMLHATKLLFSRSRRPATRSMGRERLPLRVASSASREGKPQLRLVRKPDCR